MSAPRHTSIGCNHLGVRVILLFGVLIIEFSKIHGHKHLLYWDKYNLNHPEHHASTRKNNTTSNGRENGGKKIKLLNTQTNYNNIVTHRVCLLNKH